MHRQLSTDSPITADPLRARIAQWRETRTHRGAPMPAELWAAAVGVARRHGLAATARGLGIDYATLKRRLAIDAPAAPHAGPTFIDVGTAAPGGLGACVISIDERRGRRLRLEVSGVRVPELIVLMRAAWGHRG